jgi:hypothetical protein
MFRKGVSTLIPNPFRRENRPAFSSVVQHTRVLRFWSHVASADLCFGDCESGSADDATVAMWVAVFFRYAQFFYITALEYQTELAGRLGFVADAARYAALSVKARAVGEPSQFKQNRLFQHLCFMFPNLPKCFPLTSQN